MKKPYANLDKKSGVVAYEISYNAITIYYRDNWCYLYSEKAVGKEKLAELIRRAESGRGLSSYISLMVANNYAGKWKEFSQ
jgi:hypothetical protein